MNSIQLIFLGLAILSLSACQTTDSRYDGRYKNSQAKNIDLNKLSDVQICNAATTKEGAGVFWESGREKSAEAKLIALQRGLSCGVGSSGQQRKVTAVSPNLNYVNDFELCKLATHRGEWSSNPKKMQYVQKARSKGLTCETKNDDSDQIASGSLTPKINSLNDAELCKLAVHNGAWSTSTKKIQYVQKAKSKGLSCDVGANETSTVTAKQSHKKTPTSNAITQKSSTDTRVPLITIFNVSNKGKQGKISGNVRDDSGIAELLIDGKAISVDKNGNFDYQTFIPYNGINLKIVVTDSSGLSAEKLIALERSEDSLTTSITFDRLNPLGKRVRKNVNAIALVVGIASYKNTPAKAIYADSDALMFRDYASERLGIPENRIKTMVNDKADERELLLSVKSWLSRSVRKGQTDVYIFFAGHGLASEDGKKMYLLPYDGAPELLDKTALLRKELFDDIAATGPRSVTVFLDTCYSGTTRGTDMLVASRPIAIRAKQQNIPEGFTVFTAAGGDQTAKPLEEAKHGMFSYFLMKGMEGDADINQDNQITAAELHQYVEQNVVQQSGGGQVPELQGDNSRVLVRFN